MLLGRGLKRSKQAAAPQNPPVASTSSPMAEPNADDEYVQVVASPLAEAFKTLQEMFPTMRVDVIDEVLLNNNAELEACIDECLARQAQEEEQAGPPSESADSQTMRSDRNAAARSEYPKTPQAPRAAPFIHPSGEESPSSSSSGDSWSTLLREMLGGEGSTPADVSKLKRPPENPRVPHQISYDSVASDFAAVDEDSDFGKDKGHEKTVQPSGNDGWDDWFGSKVEVPGHSSDSIVPPSDPSEVYSMSRHDSLVDDEASCMWNDSCRVLSPTIQGGRLFLEKPDGFVTIGDTISEVCNSMQRVCKENTDGNIRAVDLSGLDLTDSQLQKILESLLDLDVAPEQEIKLANNRLSVRGLADLLEYIQSVMSPRQKLKVDLSYNGICDWGMQRLAILMSESTMLNVEIDISNNRVSDPRGILFAYMEAHPENRSVRDLPRRLIFS
ncbi:hypothetical protein FOL47_004989 [Perkinsus chesapeaki]|uniref:CUE domain-containing protein n=1 Tax=Perkinsus chesapeaki TaxID=330153 RepID=A0A7J6M0Y7_PERCH|nr:hypothetical protein FOL47_004989 [Perkinsus chesapeaki]